MTFQPHTSATYHHVLRGGRRRGGLARDRGRVGGVCSFRDAAADGAQLVHRQHGQAVQGERVLHRRQDRLRRRRHQGAQVRPTHVVVVLPIINAIDG